MSILSVDLAYKNYTDVGVVVLRQTETVIQCELLRLSSRGAPSAEALAGELDSLCLQRGIRLLLLDGPQGWKAKDNGLVHSRLCEKKLNTPAKTGRPMSVKPGNYFDFVAFSIQVYDALSRHGWERLSVPDAAVAPTTRLLVESFPLSAWRSLRLDPLPAKAKTKPADLAGRLAAVQEVFPLSLSGAPNHDQLQALVSGLAGLAIERDQWDACAVSGSPPVYEEGHWCEGFIVNPLRPVTQ